MAMPSILVHMSPAATARPSYLAISKHMTTETLQFVARAAVHATRYEVAASMLEAALQETGTSDVNEKGVR